MEPGTPVRPAAALEDGTHLVEQYPVLPRVCTRRPVMPRVVTAARDPEPPTEPRHSERLVLPLDEREDVSFRAEVNRMSVFSSACSSWSTACARCNLWKRFISCAGGACFTADDKDTRPRRTPSRASFRHRDSMNG